MRRPLRLIRNIPALLFAATSLPLAGDRVRVDVPRMKQFVELVKHEYTILFAEIE